MPRIAFITGAARNIGLEVARQLGRTGITVVLGARHAAQLQGAVDTLLAEGISAHGVALDVTDDASVRAAAEWVRANVGALDILVNNAAVYADWMEVPSATDFTASHAVMETNLYGAWRVTQAMLPLLRASTSARVVNVTSGAGSHADPQFGLPTNAGSTSYAISKAALNALTSKFAKELADTPIKVNAVCPGLTATAPGMEAMGARPIPDGAASVVWAALLPDDGPTGGFLRDGAPIGW
jgi:NAD(P)-dependent dehydrogenase (short-subunit alcohol dehydrogenase family)